MSEIREKAITMVVNIRMYRNKFPWITTFVLHKKADSRDKVPTFMFGLAYDNFFIQCYLPGVDKPEKYNFHLIPTPLDIDEDFIPLGLKDLGSLEKVKKEEVSIGFQFEKMVEESLAGK